MARINRFYLLIATFAFCKTYSAQAKELEFYADNSATYNYCSRIANVDDSVPCMTCVPYAYGDDGTTGWYDKVDHFIENMGDVECPGEAGCHPTTDESYVASLGDTTKKITSGGTIQYYTCTESGWKLTYDDCEDKVVYNGTFKNCCEPTYSNGKWSCYSYTSASCNSGYTGTFTGRSGDCTACSDKIVYNGTFKDCCNPTQSGSKWTCSSYSSKFCNSGYYGTFNGNSTDCTACPESPYEYAKGIDGSGKWVGTGVKPHALSSTSNNTTLAMCYIAGSGGGGLVDGTGTFTLSGLCYN